MMPGRSTENKYKHSTGRPVGVKNKDRDSILMMLSKEVEKITGQTGYDPLKAIAVILCDPEHKLSTRDRIWAHSILAEYCYSRRKAIEVTGEMSIRHEDALKELE